MDSEDLLGKWFKANPEKRQDIFLASKFGIQMDPSGSLKFDSSPEYCRKCITKSLSRLGLDYIDLYYVHRVDGVTPIEKTMEVLVELKKEGKIRHIGLSACSATTLRRAHAVHPITAIQMEYSAFHTAIETPERALLATARELGVAVVAYSPLGRGMLTGAIRGSADLGNSSDFRRPLGLPWFQEGNLEKNMAVVQQLGELAAARGISTSQLCLAWLLAQGDDIFAIPGTRKFERLQENLEAARIVISPEEDKKIREICSHVAGSNSLPQYSESEFGNTPSL